MKIIAESAFNHQGDFEELKKLASAAKESGADYFTVQVMHVDSFCVKDYSKYRLYKDNEFTGEQWIALFDFCKSIQIDVIPCVLEETSFEWCYAYGFRLLKLHATDITNKPFLELIAEKGDIKVILETQCATTFEVEFALGILGFHKIEALFSGYSNYPTEVEDFNLNVLDTYKKKYKFDVGFADHSLDTTAIPLMILAKGCAYIEKHITLTRNNRNYDYQVSLYPHEFAIMVNTIKHYTLALGNGIKHPVKNELGFRSIMYKKIINENESLKRADRGIYFVENEINNFDKNNVVAALIARLKSQRLKQKVIKPFHNNELIIDLYNRIKNPKYKTVLATSNLMEDQPLCDLFDKNGIEFFKGDAVSVIDRLLSLAYKERAGAVFRVTGDNPFTDPELMVKMLDLLVENNLDYVKVNNVPFGIGAELFSTKYLWNLYLRLETTEFSEYLTWYVLNDENVRMGCIDLDVADNQKLVNLSVDFQEDYDRCKILLDKIGKKDFASITLADILGNLDEIERVDDSKHIKLPLGETISLKDYLSAFENKKYIVRKKM
jgi:N,N'-diacetyllegionaminate synthase